jgi:small-conductance mechanosensitive channel
VRNTFVRSAIVLRSAIIRSAIVPSGIMRSAIIRSAIVRSGIGCQRRRIAFTEADCGKNEHRHRDFFNWRLHHKDHSFLKHTITRLCLQLESV